MNGLLDGLNDAQKAAVTSPANVVQVLAPPGSGKTKTLTARVAYHINHERLQPWNIIVCTFTIKAAREMKERIKGFVGEKLESKLILGTFHSVARRFLSRYGQEIGIDKNFGIADTSDSTAILKRIIKRYEHNVEPDHARSRISKLKAKGISGENFRRNSKKVNDNEFAMVYSSYQEHLQASNLLDYDDLLVKCVELLQRSPSCVSTIQAVLIDEYQDTNNIQYELMRLLAQQTRRITIVGDPDQSIYSFRSAEIGNLSRMRTDYPESVVINLENNYRSSERILTSSMAVIEQDESRPQRALVATHGVGERPTLRHMVSATTEARWIVEEIQRTKTLTAGLLNYNDYAILLRSSPLSLQIERALGQAGVPYRMVAGTRFFDRAEIKLLLDYLRVISQPEHNDAVARIINVPSRKVGDTTVKALLEEAETKKVTLWKLVHDIAQGRQNTTSKISNQAEKGIKQFFNVIYTSRMKLLPCDAEHCNLFDLIQHVMQKISYEAYLRQAHKKNWQDRWANVEELIVQATQLATAIDNREDISDDALPVVEGLEQRKDTSADILSKFLANVTLSSTADQDGGELDQVTISTIHAAKGLEWPVVFIPAVYDGSIPHSRADDHDEERRLLYVGMTRAQALLYLSCPLYQSRQDETTLSRFISDQKMQRYFHERGPDLAFNRSAVPDLATVLRRPCPSIEDIDTARNSLARLEDDKYPATRAEIGGNDASWGASLDDKFERSASHGDAAQPTSKRRKFETTLDMTSVTMHRNNGFSIASTTMHTIKPGFTSARDLGDLHAMQQAAEHKRMLTSATIASIERIGCHDVSEADQEDKKDVKPAKAKPVKPRIAGQGAITSFFKRAETAPAPFSELEFPQVFAAPTFQRSSSMLAKYTPLTDISNVACTTPSLPPLNYKLNNRPMQSKPKRTQDGSERDSSSRYVLLCSSPMKSEVQQEARVTEVQRESPVQEVVARPVVQKRSLGMRRPLQGWSVKNKSMPKPRHS